jgi:hypothetical protein
VKLVTPICAAAAISGCFLAASYSQTTIDITSEVMVRDTSRFGINLGTWTSWGAEQLSANVLKNPGFEGLVDRAIVMIKVAGPGVFSDDQSWLARPDGFWDGAHYAVLSGTHAGEEGEIASSLASDSFGLPGFSMRSSTTMLAAGDVVALTRINDSALPTQWWFPSPSADVQFRSETANRRPGSPGTRSLRLIAHSNATAEVDSYLDAIGDRAGKLLPLEGRWRLTFWGRLDRGQGQLKVTLARDGSSPVLASQVALDSQWKKEELTFQASDNGPSGTIALRFQFAGASSGEFLLDDVDLRRIDDGGSNFRSEVVTAIARLHPGYLRDWQGQLGDTLSNRLADSLARRSTRYRPGDNSQTDFAYGLPDFLDMALRVNASPWIIVPPSSSSTECAGLGTFLNGNPAYRSFKEIVVEFGNENWNSLFRPGAIPNPISHAQASDACFSALRSHAPALPVRMTINAQHADPRTTAEFAASSARSDLVAIAPYYLFQLNSATPVQSQYPLLFQGDGGLFQQIAATTAGLGKEIAVYEVNSHADQGTAPSDQRDPVTSGLPSASALAKTMLDALALGGRRQCAYTLVGFDNQASQDSYVKLWGVVRDLGPTLRLRPTGLSLELMNQAIAGDLMRVRPTGSPVNVYAFREHDRWSVVAVSSSPTAITTRVRFPDGSRIPTRFRQLIADAPDATNEDGDHITISEKFIRPNRQTVTMDIVPYGLAVLIPHEEAQ